MPTYFPRKGFIERFHTGLKKNGALTINNFATRLGK